MKKQTRTIVGRVAETVQHLTSPDACPPPRIECPECGAYTELGTTHRCTRNAKGKGGTR